jgi:general nucleoside transport system permease protein
MNWLEITILMCNAMLLFSIPLLITALGGMFSEKSGVINISLEGIMVFGSFFSILFINLMQERFPTINPTSLILLAMLVAIVSGVILSALLAFSAVNLKANQVIGGTAINLLAAPFVIFIARTLNNVRTIQFRNNFTIRKVPLLGDIPIIGEIFFQNTTLLTYIGFIIVILAAVVIYKTRFGLRLSSVGEHPGAADSVGINVYKMRWMGVLISGGLAGLGGLAFVIASSVSFEGDVSGYGFLALAVMIFGQWKPGRIFLAAIFFGLMSALAFKYSLIPGLESFSLGYLFRMFPYLATIFALILTSKKSRVPKAAGIPYDQGSR